jgi:AAA15 family ATPase/GTPase
MYISNLRLTNITCFKEASLNLKQADVIPRVAVLLGNNGTGKTTLMRSIALGLCDPSGASGLIQELYGDIVREGENEGIVHITFSSDKIESLSLKTTIRRSSSGQITVEQETNPINDFPWDDIFACGYGSVRGSWGTTSLREYSVVDSMITLFNYDTRLQNSELNLRRIRDVDSDPEATLKRMLNKIDSILMLPLGSTKLDVSGLTVDGPWGEFMPHGSLGDGYRAMIALISDLIGWALLHDASMLFKDISGIVLIDEIEQHLHPDWQRKIVRLLNDQFPKIQFIFTTHSPLVAANASKLLDNGFSSKIFHLKQKNNYVDSSEVDENLGELDLDQVLSSEAFDHIFNINSEVAEVLKEASVLAAEDKRSPSQDMKLQHFKTALKKVMFPEGKSLIERIVEREYYTELEKKISGFKRILEEEK